MSTQFKFVHWVKHVRGLKTKDLMQAYIDECGKLQGEIIETKFGTFTRGQLMQPVIEELDTREDAWQ